VSESERDLRVQLAACYRLVAKYGMTDLIYNHITARVPGPEHHILISGYGMLYEEVTASSLIKVDLAGHIVEKPAHGYSVNAAGYIIHSAVHEARADAQCVVHTHTRAGIAVSAMEEGLLPLSQTSMRFHGRVAKAKSEVVALTSEALSGTEITLDNEAATNPNLTADAQKAGSGYGMLEWPALLRALDRVDPSYRD
jgi:ribulose-5-phosphate 4-epimerase/fuculose-1-phosphate aldolase